jgi:hypothetical protein
MSEETVNESVDSNESETEHSEVELKAMAMGWKPESQWEGPEDEWKPADEFVRTKPLFDRIESQTKKIKSLEKTLNDFSDHHRKVQETEYQRALNTLRRERKEAAESEDIRGVLDIDDQIEVLKEDFEKTKIKPNGQDQQGPSPAFQTWVQQNQWYVTDAEMHNDADGLAIAYLNNNPGATETEVFAHVDRKVRKMYPEKFNNTNRERPGAVTTGDRGGKPPKTSFKLTQQEEEIMNRFVRSGAMTKEKYIEELKKLRGEK